MENIALFIQIYQSGKNPGAVFSYDFGVFRRVHVIESKVDFFAVPFLKLDENGPELTAGRTQYLEGGNMLDALIWETLESFKLDYGT
mgnify:CR=1 FL=1